MNRMFCWNPTISAYMYIIFRLSKQLSLIDVVHSSLCLFSFTAVSDAEG